MKIIITEDQFKSLVGDFEKRKEMFYEHLYNFLSQYEWFEKLIIDVENTEDNNKYLDFKPGSKVLEISIFCNVPPFMSEIEPEAEVPEKDEEDTFNEIEFSFEMYFPQTKGKQPDIMWDVFWFEDEY